MEVSEVRELVRRPSRRGARRVGTVAVALAIAAAIGWSVWQGRMTREALDRAVAAEKAAADVRSDIEKARAQLRGRAPRDPALQRTRHEDPRQVHRVEQLYQEIDDLTRFRDRVDQTLRGDRVSVPKPKPAARGK